MFSFLKSLFTFSSGEVKEYLSEGAQLLDVRTPQEYDFNHIRESKNIPVTRISSMLSSLDTSSKYIVYCSHGLRAKRAVQILKKNGFSNIVNGKTISKVKKLMT